MKWLIFSLLASVNLFSLEPNPPTWPDNVIVLKADDPYAQEKVDKVFSENGGHATQAGEPTPGEFSNDRYAILFEPGVHTLNVNVGFYTSIIGLGKEPKDTTISTVTSENGNYCYLVGALDNFWRSAENFYTKPSKTWNNKVSMLWAVSQAAPMRRVFVDGDLSLFEYVDSTCPNPNYNAGFASGGFMADCHVNGDVLSGSQQQWLTRNSYMGSWPQGNWNMVFVGCTNAPPSHCSNKNGLPFTTVVETPVIAEKPFIMYDNAADRYYLMVPKLEKNKVGGTKDYDNVDQIDFHNVYVATDKDSAAVINGKLAQGLHIILCPGNYTLTESIQVTKPNTIVLGIGFPTLIASTASCHGATTPSPCITIGNIDGVRIAGILLQAGTTGIPTLLEWGQKGYAGDPNNPGFLYDCFARVGGPYDPATHPVGADQMVVINNGNVIGDNLWLWRADHTVAGIVYNGDNPCSTAIQVNGDDVTIYGLASEHTLGNLTEWNGENGNVYFYQSEYPYDVNTSYAGISYKVADTVQNHHAWGVGVYSYFRDHPVNAKTGIQTPTGSGIHFTNSLSVFLNGKGQIAHVINDSGDPVTHVNDQSYVCEFP
ncbi:MAG: hypothetical protein KFB93_01515 [Simkaniaceae bacterium]|nr:MAG: hypothetical protein KFB93_01515 [Simkaniaceae bacterium]